MGVLLSLVNQVNRASRGVNSGAPDDPHGNGVIIVAQRDHLELKALLLLTALERREERQLLCAICRR